MSLGSEAGSEATPARLPVLQGAERTRPSSPLQVARVQSRWDLVVINPGLVMGPPMLYEHAGTQSIHIMRRNMRGDLCVGWVVEGVGVGLEPGGWGWVRRVAQDSRSCGVQALQTGIAGTCGLG
jgi:hypothetical protein